MIRVAHLADSHLDERNRLDDAIAVHRAFVEQAGEAGVDVILHAGDFLERRSTPAERNALADFLVSCAKAAPVVGVRGNHDTPGDLDVFSRLHTTFILTIHDRPGPFLGLRRLSVHALPWFDKSYLVAALGPEASGQASTELALQAARRMLDAVRAQIAYSASTGLVPIVLGHLLVAGSETSTGQTLIGTTVELSPGDLADLGAAYVALGHVHKHQAWGNVVYAGSPQRNNFGEPEPKGWVLVEIDPERWREPGGVRWEFRELPAREIVLIEHDWTTEPGLVMPSPAMAAGALVRIRYRVRPEDLHLIDEARLRKLFSEAHELKLEAVLVHEARARCSEITTTASTFEKVRAYWQAKGVQVTDTQAERVRARLAEIEQPQQVAHAAA